MSPTPFSAKPVDTPCTSELMNAADTVLLVIDLQFKLLPHIRDGEKVVWNSSRLIRAARSFEMEVRATQQYPKGLGPTVDAISDLLPLEPLEKTAFSGAGALFAKPLPEAVFRVVLAGIETHVCVQQTALDLLSRGYRTYVAVDSVGSRFAPDHDTALRRLESAGATLVTTEAAMFEWCKDAAATQFKTISGLAKESCATT